jgi:hypothetical protein
VKEWRFGGAQNLPKSPLLKVRGFIDPINLLFWRLDQKAGSAVCHLHVQNNGRNPADVEITVSLILKPES